MLSVRMILYAVLGVSFGLGLGFGWWTVLAIIVGMAIAVFATEYVLGAIPLLIVAGAFLLVGITGLSPVSKAPTIFGAVVAVVVVIVELLDLMSPGEVPAHGTHYR